MAERSERRIVRVRRLDQDDDKGPCMVGQPSDANAILVGAPGDNGHPRIGFIESNARVEITYREGDMRQAEIRHRVCPIIEGGSYWVPGWWEEVWVARLQGLCDSRRGRREPATGREYLRIWRHRIWSSSWH